MMNIIYHLANVMIMRSRIVKDTIQMQICVKNVKMIISEMGSESAKNIQKWIIVENTINTLINVFLVKMDIS